MNHESILISGVHIIDPIERTDQTGDIFIRKGKIEHCGPPITVEATLIVSGKGLVACPGFIDLHTHLREPGFEDKETISSGTQAAGIGGFTTLCCMPNTNPPIDTAAIVEFIKKQAQAAGPVHVYPIGTITKGRAGTELSDMAELAQSGVVGFSDDGAPVSNGQIMHSALAYAADLNLPVIDHCEDTGLSRDGVINQGWVSSRLGLPGWPAVAEETMIARNISLAQITGGHAHIAHLTTFGGAQLVRQAKSQGIHVTAEVTPHHLTMNEGWLMGIHENNAHLGPLPMNAYDTRAKVNPPLRTAEDLTSLAVALKEGIIDAIATDHAPHTILDKSVPMQDAAFGISVLETAFGSLMELVHQGLIDLKTLINRLTLGPANILGDQYKKYATLKSGTPADIVVFDPNETWKVDTANFKSKGANTPLDGTELKGRVVLTIASGQVIFDRVSMEKGEK